VYAMQYEIGLPADYDMDIIRRRVAKAGPTLDDYDGLGVKAFVIRELADGSPVNQYAPFYLWRDTGAMAGFLFGGGRFENILASFGRPTVRHWTGLAQFPGPARHLPVRSASRRVGPVPVPAEPAALAAEVAREIDELGTLAEQPGVHTAALALDPQRWELVRFVIGDADTDTDATERYQVLHVSAPGLADLPAGQAW